MLGFSNFLIEEKAKPEDFGKLDNNSITYLFNKNDTLFDDIHTNIPLCGEICSRISMDPIYEHIIDNKLLKIKKNITPEDCDEFSGITNNNILNEINDMI